METKACIWTYIISGWQKTYEYLKMYLIPKTDHNARRQNETTMAVANAIKSKFIIQLTNGEAGIENREKVFLLDWMKTCKENQAKRGKKDGAKSG